MTNSRSNPVIGLYSPGADRVLSELERALPGTEILVCDRHDGLEEIIDRVDVLLVFKFGRDKPFPRQLIIEAPRVDWAQLASAGADHMAPYDPTELTVTSASGIHGEIMSEYVIATLVHLLWDFPRLLRQQRERVWKKYEVPSLAGRTMGIVGVGHVGSTIGARARCFGMKLLGVRRSGAPVEGFDDVVTPTEIDSVLARADVVVLTVPLTGETRHMIGEAALAKMKPDAYLVNVSRGGVVDDGALLRHLAAGGLAGAILDVFEEEPLPAESELWDLPNVLVTPHISSELADWPLAVVRVFLDNLHRWRHGEPLRNVVDPELGY